MSRFCSIPDEFEVLCGNRKKGFKSVDTLTGPRVQGLQCVSHAFHLMLHQINMNCKGELSKAASVLVLNGDIQEVH